MMIESELKYLIHYQQRGLLACLAGSTIILVLTE